MKVKKDFILREVAGTYVVVPVGEESLKFNAMINLNETGAFLFRQLQESDITQDELTQAILAEYDVDAKIAERDVEIFIQKALDAGVIE